MRVRSLRMMWMILSAMALSLLGLLGVNSASTSELQAQNAPDVRGEEAPMEEEGTRVPEKANKNLVIKFRYEGLLFCDVSVNGSKEKFNFLIDSGASNSILSLRLAERLGVSMQDSPVQAGGVGKQDMKLASGVVFDVNGVTFSPKICGVIDTAHVNDTSEIKLEGILGADWMQEFKTLDFDFKASTLTCVSKDKNPDEVGKAADVIELIKAAFGGQLPKALQDVIDQLGGGGLKPADQDFDDDGLHDQDALYEAIYQRIIYTLLKRYHVPDIARKVRSIVPSPLASADDDKEDLGSSIEEEMALEAAARRQLDAKLAPAELAFEIVDAKLMGMSVAQVAWWIIPCEFNSKPCKMVFDTGASATVVLDKEYADSIDVGHSLTMQVSGVGTSDAGLGLVSTIKVGDVETKEVQPAISLDLSAITEQWSVLKALGVKTEAPVGLLGLPYAMRYAAMRVDNESKKISFTPFTVEDIDEGIANPHDSTGLLLEAINNVWNSKAGSAGFTGTTLNPKDWPDEGFDGGVVVTKVRPGTSAEKNGLEAGDLVVAIVEDPTDTSKEGQTPVADMDNLKVYAAFAGKGEKWNLLIKKKRTGATIVQSFELSDFISSKIRKPRSFGR